MTRARYCFTDPRRFQPARKERLVVWAGRLSTQKRPLLFVDAIALLHRRSPDSIAGWRFEMYGAGDLEAQVRARIHEHRLEQRVVMTKAADLSSVFAISSVFVSTQAHENFTSLAMLEAMSAGNAVIAEDVGQTKLFVGDANGILVTEATPEGFANALAQYLDTPAAHRGMASASRAVATEVHTIVHFADDLMEFWRSIADAA
jgi:glycosyltransferase involved in cell wall biosynthesis